MKKFLQLSGQVEGVSTRQDGSYKVVLGTQEIPPESAAVLFSMTRIFVNLILAETEIDLLADGVLEGIESKAPAKTGKSQSQRLRAVLFRVWERAQEGEFESYYDKTMESIIEHFKKKLD